MKYFDTKARHDLIRKQDARYKHINMMDKVIGRIEKETASRDDLLEGYFLILASRILRAKFNAKPAFTNDELSYMLGCSSGTYLSAIMLRERRCSREMAEMMSDRLKAIEKLENMQPIRQPPYPEA